MNLLITETGYESNDPELLEQIKEIIIAINQMEE